MYRCPCCERTTEEPRDLRFHLMTNHRKSELADALMTELPDGEEPRIGENGTLTAPI